MDTPDEELIRQYRLGNESALSILLERYLSSVYGFILTRVANREEAEDITQDTFLKAWSRISTFAEGKSFKTWLFTIARNTAIDRLRKKKTFSLDTVTDDGEESYAQTLADTDPLPDALFDSSQTVEVLETALKKLPAEQSEVLLLHYREELSLTEVAAVLGLSVNTVKSRDRRGLIALRRLLAPEKRLQP